MASKLEFPLQLSRQYNAPLDVDSKVETLDELEVLKGSARSYEGMLTYCVESSTLYIFNKDGNFEPIGSSGSTVDVIEKDNTNAISSKGVYSGLYIEKTETIIDTPAYYSVCQSTDDGALNVVLTVSEASTEIALNEIIGQTTPEDLSTLTGDGTEYVKYIAEVSHEETHDVEKYLSGDYMTIDEWNTYFDNLEINSTVGGGI